MSEENEYVAVWENVWAHGGNQPIDVLQDRGTIECYRQIRRFVPPEPQLMLEAGCGTGRFCNLLGRDFPQSKIIGVDLSASALATARLGQAALGCENVSFQTASLFALPFPDGHFDFVFNEGVIQIFNPEGPLTDQTAVREMVRVTCRGGTVLVSVVNWACLPHTFYKWRLRRGPVRYEFGYEKSYRPGELRKLFHAAGLRDVRFAGFYPAYGFYRLSRRVRYGGRMLHALGSVMDRLDGPWLSRNFGFEVMAIGTKV